MLTALHDLGLLSDLDVGQSKLDEYIARGHHQVISTCCMHDQHVTRSRVADDPSAAVLYRIEAIEIKLYWSTPRATAAVGAERALGG